MYVVGVRGGVICFQLVFYYKIYFIINVKARIVLLRIWRSFSKTKCIISVAVPKKGKGLLRHALTVIKVPGILMGGKRAL